MINRSALLVISALLLLPGAANAEHTFKWGNPKELVAEEIQPANPQIAWDGTNFGIVFDTYLFRNTSPTSSDVYFMLVGTDGNVVKGPLKISKQKMALAPKVVWTGDHYGILYASGKKQPGSHLWDLRHYLVRFGSAGNKQGEKQMPGRSYHTTGCHESKLIWTGSEYAMIYPADPTPNDATRSTNPIFVKAKSNGKPSAVLRFYQYPFDAFDMTWNGKEIVLLGSKGIQGWISQGTAHLHVLDATGDIRLKKGIMGFCEMNESSGTSIVHVKGNNYLMAIGSTSPDEEPGVGGSLDRGETYAAPVRIKPSKIGNFEPKNIDTSTDDRRHTPVIIKAGKKFYIVYNIGFGEHFKFAKISKKGKIISSPLEYKRNGSSVNFVRPAWTGSEVGVVWAYDGLFFNIIKP